MVDGDGDGMACAFSVSLQLEPESATTIGHQPISNPIEFITGTRAHLAVSHRNEKHYGRTVMTHLQ